jgi:DMSO reductase family type II enzyme molybdopterin subunit
MTRLRADRREFLRGSGALAASLSLKYAAPVIAQAQTAQQQPYGQWEDLMRQKWTWDRVVRGSRGVNCTGHCAFDIYVKNGIVWREEQQGGYGHSGDAPDYGPRGCQKGLRQAKHMYGKQRVLYPMKRTGERGEGQWERIGWDQAIREIADKFIDYAVEHGPESITFAMGTAMIMKRAAFTSLLRFANITGIWVPETFAGVGDLPVGAHMTLGLALPGDTMAAVYKSKCCLIWMCNPAVTRIPDAHFFWEAKYNGTEVIAISPEFTPTAMHASKWVNPKPGTDTALALAMVQTILEDRAIEWDYVREQTDLPFLVRLDTRKFLRGTDLHRAGDEAARDNLFYMWDESGAQLVPAPATGLATGAGEEKPGAATLRLEALRPALEGRWSVETRDGPVEVTTVFELVKEQARDYTPEKAAAITGVHPDSIRDIARSFARSQPSMIYSGYRASKWLHGDKLQRAWLLMCALTGATGREGGGMQTTQLPKGDGIFKYVFDGIGPRLRIAAISLWDYEKGNLKELNSAVYGEELAEHFAKHYRAAIEKRWVPDYGRRPWKMCIIAGHNPANWRASGKRWRETAFANIETIVAMTPDMSTTAMYADYVLPVSHHYERGDIVMEGRTPYLQVITQAVPPLGESLDDREIMGRIARAISKRAAERRIERIEDQMFGQPITHDYTKCDELFTLNGRIKDTRDLVQFLIDNSAGLPKLSVDELEQRGIIRVDDAQDPQFGPKSPYSYQLLASTRDKKPYKTMTGRQQFYIDHDWFLAEGEQLPVHRGPLSVEGYPLRMLMGHARHGIHSLWRDDSLLISLQRGEPDIYVNPDDARARGVADGELIRVFNSHGSFVAQAHVSAGMQPGMVFMYHGWDPMMFRGRQNFGAVIPTAGLIKPTSLVGDYGHLNFRTPDNVPNQTYSDFTCNFEKYTDA